MTFIAAVHRKAQEDVEQTLSVARHEVFEAFPGSVRIETLANLCALMLHFDGSLPNAEIQRRLSKLKAVKRVAEDFGIRAVSSDAVTHGDR